MAKNSSFTINKGVLEITGNSSVNSKAIAFAKGATLRAGRGAVFRGDTIDFSKGVIFDLRPFMDDYSSGLSIEQANSHTLGGLMGVADTLDDYAHESAGQPSRDSWHFPTPMARKATERTISTTFILPLQERM